MEEPATAAGEMSGTRGGEQASEPVGVKGKWAAMVVGAVAVAAAAGASSRAQDLEQSEQTQRREERIGHGAGYRPEAEHHRAHHPHPRAWRTSLQRERKHAALSSHINDHFQGAGSHKFTREARAGHSSREADGGGGIHGQVALHVCGPGGGRPALCVHEKQGKEDTAILPPRARLREQAEARAAKARRERRAEGRGHGGQASLMRIFKQGQRLGYFEMGRRMGDEQVGGARKVTGDKEQVRTRDVVRVAIGDGIKRVAATARRIETTDESRGPTCACGGRGRRGIGGGLDREYGGVGAASRRRGLGGLQVLHTAFPRLIKRAREVTVAEVVGQPALFETHHKLLGFVMQAEEELEVGAGRIPG
ncbi:hypothetical protein V490_07759 [Pseudogymnoascus sp. VKM F-3557]|nr:hypothetical protein V490_07759 [Pseudogymnoascus sp. VKM F-3557]